MFERVVKIALLALSLCVLCINDSTSCAAPPLGGLALHRQPDGAEIRLRLQGNDILSWLETADEYVVVRREDKAYVYVRDVNGDQLIGSEHLVGVVDPDAKNISKRLRPQPDPKKVREHEDAIKGAATCKAIQFPQPRDSFGNLVIMARFSDHQSRTVPSRSDIHKIYSSVGGDVVVAPTGSVRDVYNESSYGICQPESIVVDWIDLPHSEFYYSEGMSGRGAKQRLEQGIRHTLSEIDASFDYSSLDTNSDGYVDCVSFLHSGYGAEVNGEDPTGAHVANRIWSRFAYLDPPWVSDSGMKVCRIAVNSSLHGKEGADPARVGVLSHEIGHVLRLPDMYDNFQNGNYSAGHGIGNWGIMGNCWGFDQSGHFPPHFSPYSKVYLGWVTPTEITVSGSFSITAVETTSQIYKISEGYQPGEYLLIENRQPIGFDQKIPASKDGHGGLAIWHIDEKQPGGFNYAGYPSQPEWPKFHYKYALLQSDGRYDLEQAANRGDGKDLYRGTFQSMINPSTIPTTAGYHDGVLGTASNVIENISASGQTMTFDAIVDE